jgi:hypothetical protein
VIEDRLADLLVRGPSPGPGELRLPNATQKADADLHLSPAAKHLAGRFVPPLSRLTTLGGEVRIT